MTSPVCASPVLIRCTPTTSTASVASAGSRSITGSNTERTLPTRTLASRSCSDAAANRSSSICSVPSDLTIVAASKLSCATSETAARSACTRVMAGVIHRR